MNKGKQEKQEKLSKTRWDNKYQSGSHYKDEPPTDFVVDSWRKYSKTFPNRKVIDIGCGNGRNLRFVSEQDFEAHGLDISGEAISQLKSKFKFEKLEVVALQSSFYDIPFPDKHFGCAISINVLQHNDWKGVQKAFTEMSRILLPKGIVILAVRSTSRDLPKDAKMITDHGITFVSQEGSKAGITLHHYTLEEIKELATMNKLQILEVKERLERRDGVQKAHWEVVMRKFRGDPAEFAELLAGQAGQPARLGPITK